MGGQGEMLPVALNQSRRKIRGTGKNYPLQKYTPLLTLDTGVYDMFIETYFNSLIIFSKFQKPDIMIINV